MTALIVNLDVDDLQRAVDFYCKALGLHVGRTFGDGLAGVELLGSTAPIYLLVKKAGSAPAKGVAAPRDYARHWTPVHLDFLVDDIEVAAKRVEEAGGTREHGIETQPYGHIAQYADPFGHGFCIIQFLGGGYDEIADKKI